MLLAHSFSDRCRILNYAPIKVRANITSELFQLGKRILRPAPTCGRQRNATGRHRKATTVSIEEAMSNESNIKLELKQGRGTAQRQRWLRGEPSSATSSEKSSFLIMERSDVVIDVTASSSNAPRIICIIFGKGSSLSPSPDSAIPIRRA